MATLTLPPAVQEAILHNRRAESREGITFQVGFIIKGETLASSASAFPLLPNVDSFLL
jgi:hypothetical protein